MARRAPTASAEYGPITIESKSEDGKTLSGNLEKCTPWRSNPETDEKLRKCGVVAGYELTWFDADDRQTLTLEKGRRKIEVPFPKFLNYPRPFEPYFCSLNPKVEWHLSKAGELRALIAHVVWSENEDDPKPRAEHDEVMVSRLDGADPGCIIAVFDAKAKPDAFDRARKLVREGFDDVLCLKPKPTDK